MHQLRYTHISVQCAHTVYLSIASTPCVSLTSPCLNGSIWLTHRSRWPGTERLSRCPLRASFSSSSVGKGCGIARLSVSKAFLQSFSKTTAAPQPHLTCLFPLGPARRRSITLLQRRPNCQGNENSFFGESR